MSKHNIKKSIFVVLNLLTVWSLLVTITGMNITVIGHAGLLIETNGKKIVCDPWFSESGAFLCSWFQWPRNDQLGDEVMHKIMSADYLYVSHLHRDHFDEEFLRKYFVENPDVVVLVPKFNEPNILAKELQKLGAMNLVMMPDREDLQFEGFTVQGMIDWNGTYANKGDSGICVTDESGRFVNQNDSKLDTYPANIDVHFTQFSGAIWYPMAYRKSMNDEPRYLEIIRSEIERREVAFETTIKKSGAAHVFPHAGPPVFLRDSQRWLNNSNESVFYDQPGLLNYLRSRGVTNAHVVFPEMVVRIDNHVVSVEYPNNMSEESAEAYYASDNKEKEIALYADERRSVIASFDNALPEPSEDLLSRMVEWLSPILDFRSELLDKIGGNILVESDDHRVRVLFDHTHHTAREFVDGDDFDHSFTIPRRILEEIVLKKYRVWSSEVFLGAVHESWRKGAYNRYVYDLFAQMGLPPAPKPQS